MIAPTSLLSSKKKGMVWGSAEVSAAASKNRRHQTELMTPRRPRGTSGTKEGLRIVELPFKHHLSIHDGVADPTLQFSAAEGGILGLGKEPGWVDDPGGFGIYDSDISR